MTPEMHAPRNGRAFRAINATGNIRRHSILRVGSEIHAGADFGRSPDVRAACVVAAQPVLKILKK
jgi:hypothetical protein